ncbi:MAG: SDR family oxidoreductase [Alphaproteobacteria bacterium]
MPDPKIRTALVTGASAGIGRATAKKLAAAGVSVWAAARRLDALDALARETPGVRALRLDVTDEASIGAAMARLAAEDATVDLLVNNAGFGQMGAVEDVSVDKLRYQMEVNVVGALRMAQAVLPGMRARRRGVIVNVSSPAGIAAMPFFGAYCASKAALESLTSALRMEVSDFGISIVLVRPGAIATEFQEVAQGAGGGLAEGSAYEVGYRAVARLMKELESRGFPPEPVADAIVRAALAASPPAEVNAPIDSKATVALVNLLPTGLREAAMRFAVRRLG